MNVPRIERPEAALLLLCVGLVAIEMAYAGAVWFSAGGWPPGVPRLWLLVALLATGCLPYAMRGYPQHHWITLIGSVVAVPLASACIGNAMHDLSISWTWLEHDRWCFPKPNRVLTATTVPLLLLVPLQAWAGLCAVRGAGAPDNMQNTENEA